MKRYLPYLLLALPFFLLKATNLGIWLSDTNIYFYTGYQLLQGKILYKDIFFTNFPLIPYISALYFILTNGNLPLFFFTATIEVLIAGILIYLIVSKKYSQNLALLSAALYLYSFIILATSDHQTGVFLGSLFSLLSYYFLILKKKPFLSGLFIALALLTKAYFLPIAFSMFLYLSLKNWRSLPLFLLGGAVSSIAILLPSLLTAPQDLIKDVFTYSLTRSQGIDKGRIAYFFLTHETIFVILIFWNIFTIHKRLLFGLISITSLCFFILYQDIYYLYLNFCIPFLALSFPSLFKAIQTMFKPKRFILPGLITLVLLFNLYLYVSDQRSKQKIEDVTSITSIISKEHPQFLYGINSLAPALAFLTHTPLLNGIVDTNENIFRKGFLDKKELTKDAIAGHTILISNAAIYPQMGANYPLLGGIFDEKEVEKSCQIIDTFFVKPEGVENAISLYRC